MLKKGFALLLAALLIAGLLPVGAMAASEVTIAADNEDPAGAFLNALSNADVSTITFAASDTLIKLPKPANITRPVTVKLSGQTITAEYDVNDANVFGQNDLKVLTVFNILPGGNLTLTGTGTVKSATRTGSSGDSIAFYLHSGDESTGKRSALTVAGSDSSAYAKIKILDNGTNASLFAVGSKASLTLKDGYEVKSETGTAIHVMNGANGYKLDVDVTAGISGINALVLSGDFGSAENAPAVEIGNFLMNGSTVWSGTTGRRPKYSELARANSWAFTPSQGNLKPVDAMDALIPETASVFSFLSYRTVTYTKGIVDSNATYDTVNVPKDVQAPNYTLDNTDDYFFTGWDYKLDDGSGNLTDATALTANLCIAQWATAIPVSVSGDGITVTDAHYVQAPALPAKIAEGSDLKFKVAVNDGYREIPNGGGMVIKVNDAEVLPDTNGIYTVANVNAAQTITVSGLEQTPVRTITLPDGPVGYTIASASGYTTSVTDGEDYKFTLTLSEGYRINASDFAVTATSATVTQDSYDDATRTYTYSIDPVEDDQTISVAGVEAIPSFTVSLSTDSGYSIAKTDNTLYTQSVTLSEGSDFSFRVKINNDYGPGDDDHFNVKVNGTEIFPNGDGDYTIQGIQEDKAITVEGVELKPVIDDTSATRSSSNAATFYFTSNQDGKYWYEISEVTTEPTAEHIKSQFNSSTAVCTANTPVTISLQNLNSSTARYIFVLVENDHGVQSDIKRIDLAAYTAPPAATYTVALPSGEGYTAAAYGNSSSPVTAGGSFSFTVTLKDGYRKNGFAVRTNNNTLLNPDSSGVYTINNINANQSVTVSGVELIPKTYTVELKSGTGYTVNAVTGSVSPVAAGGSYSFTVTLKANYSRGNSFAVKANDTVLTASNGIYTIKNIQANQTVTVTGVNYSGGSSSGGTTATAPSITTTALAAATLGTAYSQQLSASGTAPITWTYTGTLPDGISLGSTTGLLSGTPTSEGTFRFAVKASNSRGTATRQMTLVVSGESYTVTAGNNAQWTKGTQEGLTFQGSGKDSFSVQVDGATVEQKNLTYSTDKTAVTLSADYLETLSTGSHTITLVYKNGNAKAKFSIRGNPKNTAPAITAQPLSGEVKEGDSVTFNVTATGTAPMTYNWQVDKGDGKGWVDVAGGSSATLTVKKISSNQNGWKYRCVVQNEAGKIQSNAATLTVKGALGTVTASASASPSPTPAAVQTKKSSPFKTILAIAGGVIAASLAGVGGVWYYRKRKYGE